MFSYSFIYAHVYYVFFWMLILLLNSNFNVFDYFSMFLPHTLIRVRVFRSAPGKLVPRALASCHSRGTHESGVRTHCHFPVGTSSNRMGLVREEPKPTWASAFLASRRALSVLPQTVPSLTPYSLPVLPEARVSLLGCPGHVLTSLPPF